MSARGDRTRSVIVSALLVDLVLAVGVLAVWPIHESPAAVLAAGVGAIIGHVVAGIGMRWRWSPWWVALAALGGYAVAAVPVVAPASLAAPDTALRAVVGVLTAPVTGWKDLLTLELPLGTYQTTLAPVLLVFTAAATTALSLVWRARRAWVLGVPAALAPTVFGVVFGARSLSAPLAGVRVQPELLVGLAALLSALALATWRVRHDRRHALAAAAAASPAGRRPRRRPAGRAALAAGMLVVAVLVAGAAAPWALAGAPRGVARADVAPVLDLERALSPLSSYRAFFTDGQGDEELFRIDAPAGVDRVRLAALPFYDGRTVRAVDPATGDGDPSTAFTRVPSRVAAVTPADAVVEVRIAGWDAIWMPTAGSLRAVAFDGPRAGDLADGFFHSAATDTAVATGEPGFTEGDRYRLTVANEPAPPALATLTPARTDGSLPDAVVPPSLDEWIEAQDVPTGGAGLELLIDRLRDRGYLSHVLLPPDGPSPAWAADLDSGLQPSRAGHSTDRVGTLFSQLLERQRERGDAPDAELVAAVGDDEQFAVAAMLLADRLGFDARVVLGARLSGGDDAPSCDAGVCRGGDLAAWIEVQDAGGTWVAVDASPRATSLPSPDLDQRSDPENPTVVRPDAAEPVLPADGAPGDGARPDDDDADRGPDLAALWTVLRVGGLSLSAAALLLGPLLAVLAAKAWRRRGRRRRAAVADRVVGGWEEYVDAAVDHGLDAPPAATRQELATLWAGTGGEGARLATAADRAVFAAAPPSDADGEEYWRIVTAERRRLAAGRGVWARWRARLSLRSLRRNRHGGARGRR